MNESIFVNLAVDDLQKSIEFFKALGYTFNEQFTDDNAGCLVIGPNIYAMLVTKGFFKSFTNKPIADAKAVAEVLTALSCKSRADVDEICDKALAAGATHNVDAQDHGFMYERSFQDLDGHVWSYFYMDQTHVQ